MEIVYNIKDLREYMATAVKVSPNHPGIVDKYIKGIELEADALPTAANVSSPESWSISKPGSLRGQHCRLSTGSSLPAAGKVH